MDGITVTCTGEDVWEVEGLVVSSQFHKQIKSRGENFIRAAVRTVNLVDYDHQF